MRTPPSIPQFGQVPVIGQRQQPTEAQMRAQIQAAISQLSMAIYTKLVTTQAVPFDQDRLRKLAKDAQVAARCYFEGVGIIEAAQQNQGDQT